MLLAMGRDIRVILIKLADRLHNMRTLSALPRPRQREIARETLDIYAPIANRLGMRQWFHELEDRGFAYLYPQRYRVLEEAVRKRHGNRKAVVEKIRRAIVNQLQQEGVVGEVSGREKNVYSIYKKMRQKNVSFDQVYDVYAFVITSYSIHYTKLYETTRRNSSALRPLGRGLVLTSARDLRYEVRGTACQRRTVFYVSPVGNEKSGIGPLRTSSAIFARGS